jgi:glucosylceramidase
MLPRVSRILLGSLFGLWLVSMPAAASAQGELWITNPDRSALFQKQSAPLVFGVATNTHVTIDVDGTKTYQTILTP